MSVPWFRLYNETVSDPKIQTLDLCTKWMWITCLCIASASNERGLLKLGNVSATFRELSSIAGIPFRAGDIAIRKLIDRAMLIEGEDGSLTVKNWAKRQFSSDLSTERVRRSRERKRGGETFPQRFKNVAETDQNTDNRIQIEDKKEGADFKYQPLLDLLRDMPLETFPDDETALKTVSRWGMLYPHVNIPEELMKMQSWLSAQPKGKYKDFGRFALNWLRRAEENAKAKLPKEEPATPEFVVVGEFR